MNEHRISSASNLARRPDIVLGHAVIRPSTRTVDGPDASAILEPKVMLVLLALVDAQGAVLGRDELMSACWPGVIVGDDAINRAIGEIRRAIRETSAGFEIETIPRIGYRFVGTEVPAQGRHRETLAISRRAAMAGGAVALAGMTGSALWYRHEAKAARAQQLIEEGRQAYLLHDADSGIEARRLFAEATRIAPDRADGWGWLAAAILAQIESAPAAPGPAIYDAARRSAQRALSIQPDEPNARTVMSNLEEGLRDWGIYQAEMQDILAAAPGAIPACEYLTAFLQGLGYCKASWDLNEQGIAHEPFAPIFQQRRGMKCWIFGRIGEADRVFDRAMRLWPSHPLILHSNMTVLAFTGRPEAARRSLGAALQDGALGPQPAQLWHAGLDALESGSAANVARARETALRLAPQAQGLATNALMLLSHLGELDAAYAIAEGQLQSRGALIARGADARAAGQLYAEEGWRETQWMFTPAAAAFRDDPRFTGFCDAIGHLDHWRRRGQWPDAFVRGSLRVGQDFT